MILLSFERYLRGALVAAGIALGLAAAIKVSPILLILVFVLDRAWRAVGATVATGAIAVAISFILAGPDLHWAFLAQLKSISSLIGIMHINYTFELVLYELGIILGWTDATIPVDETGFLIVSKTVEPVWITIATRAFLVIGVAATLWMTQFKDKQQRTLSRLAGLYMVAALAAPLAWAHHFLLVMFLLPGLFHIQTARVAFLVVLLFFAAFSLPGFSWMSLNSADMHLAVVCGFAAIVACYGAMVIRRENAPTTQILPNQADAIAG